MAGRIWDIVNECKLSWITFAGEHEHEQVGILPADGCEAVSFRSLFPLLRLVRESIINHHSFACQGYSVRPHRLARAESGTTFWLDEQPTHEDGEGLRKERIVRRWIKECGCRRHRERGEKANGTDVLWGNWQGSSAHLVGVLLLLLAWRGHRSAHVDTAVRVLRLLLCGLQYLRSTGAFSHACA